MPCRAQKTAKDRERFGKGDVRGVLGPGAANNSKEGGDLVPTIAFGVPGSGAMAILLGGFMIMGLVPGPDMLSKHLAVTYSMVWTLVIANIITVVLSLAVLNQLAKVTYIQRRSDHSLRPITRLRRQLHRQRSYRRPDRNFLSSACSAI